MDKRVKMFLRILPHIILVASASITLVLLYCDQVSQTFALLMILFILTAYILDQAIENLYYGEKFQNVQDTIKMNTDVTELIHDELHRRKDPCEIVDPCTDTLWRFEKEMMWFNAPLVLAEEQIFERIRDTYEDPAFTKAKYLFYNGGTEADKKDFEKRLKRFKDIKKRLAEAAPRTAGKISARVVNDIPPRHSFFLGKKGKNDECVVYIMERPFILESGKEQIPGYVFSMRERGINKRLRNIFNNEWSKGEPLKE
jgi:hypothetical protein